MISNSRCPDLTVNNGYVVNLTNFVFKFMPIFTSNLSQRQHRSIFVIIQELLLFCNMAPKIEGGRGVKTPKIYTFSTPESADNSSDVGNAKKLLQ